MLSRGWCLDWRLLLLLVQCSLSLVQLFFCKRALSLSLCFPNLKSHSPASYFFYVSLTWKTKCLIALTSSSLFQYSFFRSRSMLFLKVQFSFLLPISKSTFNIGSVKCLFLRVFSVYYHGELTIKENK